MDKIYVCTQCNAEYDAPGMCEMCDVELVLETEEKNTDDDEGNQKDRFGEFAEEDDELKDDSKEEESELSEEEPSMEMNEDEENYS